MDFWGFTATTFVIGVLIITTLVVVSRLQGGRRSREIERPQAVAGKLLDASVTRRWMRFGDPNEDQ